MNRMNIRTAPDYLNQSIESMASSGENFNEQSLELILRKRVALGISQKLDCQCQTNNEAEYLDIMFQAASKRLLLTEKGLVTNYTPDFLESNSERVADEVKQLISLIGKWRYRCDNCINDGECELQNNLREKGWEF